MKTDEEILDRKINPKKIRESSDETFESKMARAAEAVKAPGLADLIAKVKAENEAAKKKDKA